MHEQQRTHTIQDIMTGHHSELECGWQYQRGHKARAQPSVIEKSSIHVHVLAYHPVVFAASLLVTTTQFHSLGYIQS